MSIVTRTEPQGANQDATRLEELLRAFLLSYTSDRLGRPAPVQSRVLAHDALDALAALAGR